MLECQTRWCEYRECENGGYIRINVGSIELFDVDAIRFNNFSKSIEQIESLKEGGGGVCLVLFGE